MKVGDLAIEPVADGVAREKATTLLRYTGPADDPWAPHQRFLDADGVLELALGGFLVRTGDRLVLIDAGVGRIDNPKYRGGAFLRSLEALGVKADEVTDVVLTHLHFDHVGWTTQRGEVVFPRATYRCHVADWAHFVDGPAPEEGSVRKLSPLAGHLEVFDADTTLAPGIDVRHAPGHTPGSVIVVVSSGEQRAVLLGDVVHCPVEMMDGDWQMIFDVDPALAARTREALARELEGSDIPIAAAHFPGMQFGRLLPGTGRRGWVFDGPEEPAGGTG
jgi:glyoxylase-like metal-dependent hydrolase (beta-lactamase superfamily II)